MMKATIAFCILACVLATSAELFQPNWLPQESQYVRTPYGFVWSECIHHMRSGDHVIDVPGEGTKVIHEDGTTDMVPLCEVETLASLRTESVESDKSTDAEGWQVFSSYQNENNATFDSFLGYFNVPSDPTNWPSSDQAILYMFTGLQSDDWVPYGSPPFSGVPRMFDIIQPVLQYGGASSGGGGRYWAVASWYVTVSAGYLVSDLIRVKSDQSIFGNMTHVGDNSWFISSVLTETGQSTNLTVTKPQLASQPWAYCTLEVYDINQCTWFPPQSSTLVFSQLALEAGGESVTPTWDVDHPKCHNPCGVTIAVESPQQVTITFPSN